LDQKIGLIKIIQNGTLILGYADDGNLYIFDMNGHSRLILSGKNWLNLDNQ
jgi:hypothetical protein